MFRNGLAALFVLSLCCMPAPASEYVARDGYFWLGSNAYARYWQPPYYNGYHQVAGYYFYVPAYVAPTYTAPAAATITVTAADPGWRNRVLDIAKTRDENKAFQDALLAIGVQPGAAGAGYAPSYGYGASHAITNHGVHGATIFGYSSQALAQLYGDQSAALAVQGYVRAVDTMQSAQGKAIGDLGGLAYGLASKQSEAAQNLTAGLAAAMALQAARPSGQTQTTTSYNGGAGSLQQQTIPQQQQQVPQMPLATDVPQQQQVSYANQRQVVISMRCAGCHSGATPKGGLNLGNYASLSPEARASIWDRVTTQDPQRRMPRRPDGGAGEPLPERERNVFGPQAQ